LLAGLLRLLPWPLPSRNDRTDASDGVRQETPLALVVTYMTPILCSVYLWARLGLDAGTTETEGWLTALSLWAGMALLVSALQAWSAREPEQLIDRVAPYGAALSLLAAGLGLPPQWQLLVGASAVLSACAVYVGWTQCQYLDLGDPSSFWRVAPTGLAMLSLAGLPFTIGFPARAAIYDRIFTDGRWIVLLLTMIGEVGMLGALLRVLLEVECPPLEPASDGGFNLETWRRNLGYGAGATLAVAIVILGMVPGLIGAPGLASWFRLPRMHVWAALLLPAVGAIALYRSEEHLTAWLDEWWPLLRRLLNLRWIWRGLEQVARALATVVWTASYVVEGAGYTAWVLLFCLIALLFLQTG
jgi:hypothetical protein